MVQLERDRIGEASGGSPVSEEEIVARAEAMRARLIDEQAATEERTFYSEETHEAFAEAGFYRMHVPKRYGGLEHDIPTYYRVIMAVSRGCPSTGWMLSPGAGHAQQVGAFYPEQAQDEIFGDGHFVASASFAYENALATPVDGGYLVRGTWHFCSGVPYATHHLGMVPTKTEELGIEDLLVVVIPRDKFRRLDNWGDLIGLRGSGSHSVTAEETFIPSHHAVPFLDMEDGARPSIGFEIHGNPLYAGRFAAFAVGRLTAVQVGNAQAAVDEFERLIEGKKTMSITGTGIPKREEHNYQRCLGLALAWTDAAYSIQERVGELYMEYARHQVEQRDPFTDEKGLRLYGQQMTAARLCWEAGDTVFRAGSTTGARDGQRMQRYWRDLCAFRTNGIHQHDFRAGALTQAHLGLPINFL
jgi:3-hydroxy-9,10-secoandrosta-1,3,5(10)-triene-9,17-dione monooxygenase